MISARGRRAALLACWLLCTLAAFAAGQRPITEKDLFQFIWIADPQVSPDGSQVAFVRVVVNDKKDDYDTSIWTVSTRSGEPRMLTSGTRDTSPQWSPEGTRLAFVRSVEKDGKRQPPQVYILPLTGGEPWPLTRMSKGASRPTWSPDGRTIAFNSTTTAEDEAKEACKGDKDKESESDKVRCGKPEHESDVHVVSRAVYRMNGIGYLDFTHPSHIWSTPAGGGGDENVKPKQLTAGEFSEQEATWAPDGSRIYFVSNRTLEPYYELAQNAVYSVPATGGESKEVTRIEGGALHSIAVSRDGKRMAFFGSLNQPVRSYTQEDLWVVDLAPGAKPRNLTANFDWDVGSAVFGDQGSPRASGGSHPLWSADGNSLVVLVGREGRGNLERFDGATGKNSVVTRGDQAVGSYVEKPDGGMLVVRVSTPTNIGDLFVVLPNGSLQRLTDINHKLFSQLNLTEPEEITYTSFDGKKIQAWAQKPPDFDPKKKYPLILNIHGGPHGAYGYIFEHEFQWMAAKGYVVLYPNPRGSTTYGQEFGNIIQYHYPGDDFKDLMAGVDELIRRGYIDEKRLGVTGGSGGGLLTNWVVGHTTRFAAAVSQRDIASWAAWWYSADFTLFQPNWFRKPPFEDSQDYVERSPITYINEVKTPLMLILGDADWRTPEGAGGEEMFRALKYRKVPTAMVRFPGESHELSRSGQPWHRIERLEHIVNWFEIYLQGKKIPGYEPGEENVWK
jgi:dipeptidyl aminopeptidase/acylaminoacyl peptidase